MTVRLGLRDWGPGELLAGLLGTLGLASQRGGERALGRWFGDAFGRPAFALSLGRGALAMALDCLRAEHPARTRVVLPALACPALAQTVRACGLAPVYADIGEDLNTPVASVAACLSAETLAVILVHAYGRAADTPAMARLCRDAGIGLIDDAAQRIDPGSGLGTAGDFGIFSFAQSKCVVSGIAGSGGVLLVNAARHLPAIAARYPALPIARGRRLAWLEFLAMPYAPRLAYYLARLRARRGPFRPAPARIGALDAAIALEQLATLEARRVGRLERLAMYARALQHAGVVAPQLVAGGEVGYLARLLVRVPAPRRAASRAALSAAGVATRLPYALPDGVTDASHPQASRAARELLELPLAARLRAADASRIAAILAPGRGRPTDPTIESLACSTTGN